MKVKLTSENVWTLISEGCNANEISEYAGVSKAVAVAMMARATREHAAGGSAKHEKPKMSLTKQEQRSYDLIRAGIALTLFLSGVSVGVVVGMWWPV